MSPLEMEMRRAEKKPNAGRKAHVSLAGFRKYSNALAAPRKRFCFHALSGAPARRASEKEIRLGACGMLERRSLAFIRIAPWER